MPRFEPFPGLRYSPSIDPADVTAPPYDVLDAEQRAALLARHPDNAVGIDLPVVAAASAGTGGADEVGGGDDVDPYDRAAATFRRWQADGVLVRDEPAFYVYRMAYVDETGRSRHTTGIIGALELSAPGEGGILPHEQTTKKARSDRLDLQRATSANLSAVWGLSPATGLTALLDTTVTPDASWDDEAGVNHTLWVVTDAARQRAIAERVGAAPVVIADGHHRYETALAYRSERPDQPGAGAVMCYVVELAEDELTVHPIHRLLSGLADDLDLLAALDPFFEPAPLADTDAPALAARLAAGDALVLVTSVGAWALTPRPDAFPGVRDLDTSRVDHALAGIGAVELIFQHGVANVVERVAKGDAQAGLLLRPATVAQIVDIADGGERMPPKTTFFYPKPRTGVVFRTLDEA